MVFGGSGGIQMDGVKLRHSKSFSDHTRIQEVEIHSFHKKKKDHKPIFADIILSKSNLARSDVLPVSERPSNSTMRNFLSKDCETLKQEVLRLEKLLETQLKLRHALESCLGYNLSSEDYIDIALLPKSTVELIEDVLALKLEVTQLEKYLSSLHHKAFNQQVPSFKSAKNHTVEFSQPEVSLSSREIDAKAFRACHSMPEHLQDTSGVSMSLAKRLGTRFADLLPETPNRLSEDMIKCMSAIYCKLSNPPLALFSLNSQSFTSLSVSKFSPPDDSSNLWSPALGFEDEGVKPNNPYNVDGLIESNGPYSTLVEVLSIYRHDQKLSEVEHLLIHYQSIISRLEDVDPKKLTHEEKLAFWINIHNSLAMNAFLAFGIPNNNLKRTLFLHKAAYNIGGHLIHVDTIQSYILRCRTSHPGKLVPARSVAKTEGGIKAYAIDKPEPLLYFALSSGCHSDPAVVHAFTAADIRHELETAKNEYISASFGIMKRRKIHLPKLVETFCRDSGISHDKVLKTVILSLPDSFCKRVKKSLSGSRSVTIEWVPHNFSFRYLFSIELAKYSVTYRRKIPEAPSFSEILRM